MILNVDAVHESICIYISYKRKTLKFYPFSLQILSQFFRNHIVLYFLFSFVVFDRTSYSIFTRLFKKKVEKFDINPTIFFLPSASSIIVLSFQFLHFFPSSPIRNYFQITSSWCSTEKALRNSN